MSQPKITIDLLLSEMQRLKARGDGDGGMSGPEIKDALKLGSGAVQRLLNSAIATGMMEVRWVNRLNRVGVVQRRPCYFPVHQRKSAKK